MENTAATPVTPPSTSDIPKEARSSAMLCHIAALAGYIIPFGNIIGPLVFWQMKKADHPFVDQQGKEAVNFQITVLLAIIICIPLMFVIIGIILLPVVGIGALVLSIMAAMKANEGIAYRYPFALRLVK